jgi:CheY-like chemotaxis protein
MTPSKSSKSVEKVHDLTAQSVPPGTRSVLILEDDQAFAEAVSLFLEDHSFIPTCVTSGVEGLLQILAKDFDIILCDLAMPNVPGDMFYIGVQRARRHLCKRFIFMTGHKGDPRWGKFLAKISGPVLEKPFSLEELLSTMETLLTELALNISPER